MFESLQLGPTPPRTRPPRNGYTPDWSKSIAVGSEEFISEIQNKLGVKATWRKIDDSEGHSLLHEPGVSYN